METVKQNILILALFVLIIAIVYAVIRYIWFYKHEHFVCPKCNYQFKPKLIKMILSVNAVEGKIVICPNCGSKEYVEPIKDTTSTK